MEMQNIKLGFKYIKKDGETTEQFIEAVTEINRNTLMQYLDKITHITIDFDHEKGEGEVTYHLAKHITKEDILNG